MCLLQKCTNSFRYTDTVYKSPLGANLSSRGLVSICQWLPPCLTVTLNLLLCGSKKMYPVCSAYQYLDAANK